MTRRGLAVATLGVAALAGCGADDSPRGSFTWGPGTLPPAAGDDSPQPNGEVVRVRSIDNSFRPETIEVAVGTEVWWTNDGRNDHDVLPVDDAETWGVERESFVPGDEYRFVFFEPGEYRYYCSIHGTKDVGMVGTVIVTAP